MKFTEKMKQLVVKTSKLQVFLVGVVLGILSFVGYKLVSYDVEHTHYHANYALVVNGVQEKFESFSYYEELTGCSIDTAQQPKQRAHMHEPENTVVHVHDEAVTWGNFLGNIGISVGVNHVSTSTELYTADDDQDITYILNGKVKRNIAPTEISSADRLLIVVGSDSENEAMDIYETVVPSNAAEFNESSDPGACSSNESHGFTDRLRGIL